MRLIPHIPTNASVSQDRSSQVQLQARNEQDFPNLIYNVRDSKDRHYDYKDPRVGIERTRTSKPSCCRSKPMPTLCPYQTLKTSTIAPNPSQCEAIGAHYTRCATKCYEEESWSISLSIIRV